MKACVVSNNLIGRKQPKARHLDQFYSVEVSIRGLSAPYQFKIWNMSTPCMSVLVKEYSDILSRLKVGDTLNMKYYSCNSPYRPECLKTVIRHITKNDQGRFKGHYVVDLEIVQRG